MRRSRKPLSVCADPGFESLSLRQIFHQVIDLYTEYAISPIATNIITNIRKVLENARLAQDLTLLSIS